MSQIVGLPHTMAHCIVEDMIAFYEFGAVALSAIGKAPKSGAKIVSLRDMKIDEQTKRFIREHAGDDLNRLLLGAARFPDIDVPFAVGQIAARRQVREKLPRWYAEEDIVYPSRLAAEQCSSELTAAYKQELTGSNERVCDLTGGLGVDAYYLSLKAREVVYVERFAEYAEAARGNMAVLGAANIDIRQGDATCMLESLPDPDLFYIDPARRGESNRRLFALSDCEPDLVALLPALLRKAPRVVAKLSPMADIRQTLALLPRTTAVHVLSVRNECKELLFVVERDAAAGGPAIRCVDFPAAGGRRVFSFTAGEELAALPAFASAPAGFLYEPNAAVMKAGAFKTVALRFGVEKLAVSSHLYVSAHLREDFPGRVFRIESVIPFQSKRVKELAVRFPKANIAVRNFPLTVDELRRRTRIRDGGDVYLFGTTLRDGAKVIVEARRLAL